MSDKIRSYAATAAKGKLERFDYDPGVLKDDEVEIAVQYCGICHSDLSMLDNEWGMSSYPFVPGHEVTGKIVSVGKAVTARKVGDIVGMGWFSGNCQSCYQCVKGDQNLCKNVEQTIVGRYGGFADRVRCNWLWATPLPAGIDAAKAGPLFCGGITVFNPIIQAGVLPTDRVGVIGIGGLGHMALQFLSKWGCHVVAFTSTDSKRDEAMQLGATEVVNSRDSEQMKKLAGSLDFVLSTVNVPLDWDAIIETLAPKGRLHFVGAVLEPVPVQVFSLMVAQKSIAGSPLGSPSTTSLMIDFAARHKIAPVTEFYPMSKVNEALDHVRSGKARYRVVLQNDLG